MWNPLDSITVRTFLILIGGTMLSGALVFTLAGTERKNLESHLRTHHATERIEQAIQLLDSAPQASRQAIAQVYANYGLRVDLTPTVGVVGQAPDSEITQELRQQLGSDRPIEIVDQENKDCPAFTGPHPEDKPHCISVFTALKDGTRIKLDVARHDHPPPPFRGNFMRDLIIFMAGLAVFAWIVALMTTRPLRRLARAANALGSNLKHPPLAETPGPREVREASIAFNRMQASIQSYIQERTFMLSAIAHDLQTPLTRLRLRLEKVSDPALRTALVADLTVTQSLVREGLDYAHTITTDEPFELVDIDSLTEALCNDAIDAGSEITFDGTSNTTIWGSPLALRRCISNLMDNAVKYGQFAHVSVQKSAGKALISVIDGGEGIPAHDLEKVFQPFHRLEDSRSRESGGTGLGLTIARIIAERHQGRITLKNMGVAELGLVAVLELPLAPSN